MAVIAIEGMKFTAFIGCYPGEHVLGSEIEVSVKLAVSSEVVESTDDISKTINYEEIYWLVSDVTNELTGNGCKKNNGENCRRISFGKKNKSAGGKTASSCSWCCKKGVGGRWMDENILI